MGEKKSQPFALRLSVPLLAFGGLLVALTVGWAFVMGFMVGRGDNPGERLASLTGFGGNIETVSRNAFIPNQPQGKEITSEEPPSEEEAPPKKAPIPKKAPVKKSAEPEKSEEAHPFVRPKGQSVAAWGESPVQVLPKKEDTPTEQSRSEYFYRVATYKTKNEAEELAKQCAGPLRKAYVQQNGTLYSVYLNTKMNADEYTELQKLFSKLRVKDPFLLAKKEPKKAKETKKP